MKELSSRHEEDSKAALVELASQKDKAMECAIQEWEADKRKLIENVLYSVSSCNNNNSFLLFLSFRF